MISRIWHGWTNRENADKYESLLIGEILPGIDSVRGYKGAHLLRREQGERIEFVTITHFDSLDAVRAFAGDDYEVAVIHPSAQSLIEDYDRRSQHYETIATPEPGSRTMSDRVLRWFDYEMDSHAKMLESLNAVPEHKRSSVEFQKALDLAAHLVAGRSIWLFRMGGAPDRPRDFFPTGVSLDELKEQFRLMHSAWKEFLEGLDDGKLSRIFEYRTGDGEPFRNSIEDVVTQLFGHSSYHRGQIAALLRSIGCEPAATDFIFWARERVQQGEKG
jgi:uncharacterized damage-inducible protein DinB/heme-degrading monooxygenase HmoA